MLVRRKKPRDDVPTLTDVVEGGPLAAKQEPPQDQPAREDLQRPMPSVQPHEQRAQLPLALDLTIEKMISNILNRHMANAREEITRAVLAEVHARLAKRAPRQE
jgi:hypothetical protein